MIYHRLEVKCREPWDMTKLTAVLTSCSRADWLSVDTLSRIDVLPRRHASSCMGALNGNIARTLLAKLVFMKR